MRLDKQSSRWRRFVTRICGGRFPLNPQTGGKTMIRSVSLRAFAGLPLVLAALWAASSARAQNPPASLFICDVPASNGGCENGASSPEGFVTFDFSGFTDAFIGGLPATSPTVASESGTDLPDLGLAKIGFSFFWLAMGTNTTPQTIFFETPDGHVADVLNYSYSRTGLDQTNLFGYVISSETPLTVAELEADGVTPTGFASASGPFDFPNTDITSTFQPGVPEPSTWTMMLLGFAGFGYAGYRIRRTAISHL
jgi:hypothetical protein